MSDATVQSSTRVTAARVAAAPRHYVVNLTSGTESIEIATVQHPDALAKYQVYTRQLTVNDTIWHQLRLGFFSDAASAEKAAVLLRDDFPLARVAPASTREWSERAKAALVALVAADLSTPAIAKADAGRTETMQPKRALARAPSATHVALSSPSPARQTGNSIQEGTPTKCDVLTAHPWDPRKLTEGVYWNQVPAARAVLACKKAVRAEPGARNMFQYARALAKSKEFVEAAQWYHKAASQGYVQAQYALGDIYEFGEGVELNYVLAQRWYQKAADQGYTHASVKLSRLNSSAITNIRQQMATAGTLSTSTQ
jgi:TPR repeat protein